MNILDHSSTFNHILYFYFLKITCCSCLPEFAVENDSRLSSRALGKAVSCRMYGCFLPAVRLFLAGCTDTKTEERRNKRTEKKTHSNILSCDSGTWEYGSSATSPDGTLEDDVVSIVPGFPSRERWISTLLLGDAGQSPFSEEIKAHWLMCHSGA